MFHLIIQAVTIIIAGPILFLFCNGWELQQLVLTWEKNKHWNVATQQKIECFVFSQTWADLVGLIMGIMSYSEMAGGVTC